jgi:hypothetical protein
MTAALEFDETFLEQHTRAAQKAAGFLVAGPFWAAFDAAKPRRNAEPKHESRVRVGAQHEAMFPLKLSLD